MSTLFGTQARTDVRMMSFDRPREPKIGVLDYIEERKYFDDIRTAQLHRFLSGVGMKTFDVRNRMSFDNENPLYSKVFYECEDGDIRWDGHMAASYVSLRSGEYSECVFGFADQDMYAARDHDPSVMHTFLHSFCASLGSNLTRFIDPHMDVETDYWIKRFTPQSASKGRSAITRPRFVPEDFHSYTGVVLPRQVVDDVFHGPLKQDRGHGILWGYLRESIFIDPDRTNWFIDVVKNGGKGWEYTPLNKK